jgi:hypothetical protein
MLLAGAQCSLSGLSALVRQVLHKSKLLSSLQRDRGVC